MTKIERYVNLSFLILLGLLLGRALYQHLENQHILSINAYIGIAVWLFSIMVWLLKYRRITILLLLILVLYTFNVVNFSDATNTIGLFSNNSQIINPIALLLLTIYGIINRSAIRQLVKGSDKEELQERNQKIEFYHKMFTNLNERELNKAFGDFKEYPVEAQIALDKIRLNKARV